MFRNLLIRVLLTLIVPTPAAFPQQHKSGDAKTTAHCSPATTGDNNTFIYKWCGTDPAQEKKVIALLNKVLAGQDSAAINSKLDELLQVANRPVQSLICTGSACAQGAGAQATYNQYGAPRYSMSDGQSDIVRNSMAGFAGQKVVLMVVGMEPDTSAFAGKLKGALEAAGIQVIVTTTLMTDAPSGISFAYGHDRTLIAYALANAMANAQLLQLPASGRDFGNSDALYITVSPRR